MAYLIKIFAILILPITLTACARAQGALAPTGDAYAGNGAYTADPNQHPVDQFLPDVQAGSLEPIINYVDGLNLALTGDFKLIKSLTKADCPCLGITKRLSTLFKTATLIGGDYKLQSIKLINDGLNQKSFQVQINRSDIKKVDKVSRVGVRWSASQISNQFIIKKVGEQWLLSDIK